MVFNLIKKCLHCGKEFETKNPQKLYCNDQHYRPCPVCGKPVAMIDNDFSRPAKCCSKECSKLLRQQKFAMRKCIECGKEFTPRSGVQQICDRRHTRICKICGKEFEVSRRDIQDDVVVCCHECSVEFTQQKNVLKYGVDHPMQLQQVRDKLENTMMNKYGVKHALQNKYLSEKQQENAYKTNLERNGVPYACLLPQCVNAQGKIVSTINLKFGDRLDKLDIKYSFEKRIEDKSFDICLPDSKTLIEIDPSYTHNIVGNHWGPGIEVNYHLQKTKLAERHDYRCVHVFDWDDVDKIVSLFLPRKSIYARNCQIYKINLPVAVDFLNRYHLQGSCKGQLLCLGLVKDDVLYQIMTFGKARYDKKHDIELLRLCTRPGYSVVGGASKLFSYATSEYALNNIISYCDVSNFSGTVYENIGMKFVRSSPPQIVWSKGDKKITANLLRQRGYDQLFKTNYGKGVSNDELMLTHDWLPVPDCGQKVFEYNK